MIGVVVWSSRAREQAVIWCDDHAALAFLAGRTDYSSAAAWLEPGDMVQLESETEGEVRYARSVRPIDEPPRRSLPELLKRDKGTRHLALVHDRGDAAQPRTAAPAERRRQLAAAAS